MKRMPAEVVRFPPVGSRDFLALDGRYDQQVDDMDHCYVKFYKVYREYVFI